MLVAIGAQEASAQTRAISGVVEDTEGAPLAAEIEAYPSLEGERGGACPSYNDRISVATSRAADGVFNLLLDSGRISLALVVCRSGFAARIERAVPIRPEYEWITPKPLVLVSNASPYASKQRTVENAILGFLSDMSYVARWPEAADLVPGAFSNLASVAEERGDEAFAAQIRALEAIFVGRLVATADTGDAEDARAPGRQITEVRSLVHRTP